MARDQEDASKKPFEGRKPSTDDPAAASASGTAEAPAPGPPAETATGPPAESQSSTAEKTEAAPRTALTPVRTDPPVSSPRTTAELYFSKILEEF